MTLRYWLPSLTYLFAQSSPRNTQLTSPQTASQSIEDVGEGTNDGGWPSVPDRWTFKIDKDRGTEKKGAARTGENGRRIRAEQAATFLCRKGETWKTL